MDIQAIKASNEISSVVGRYITLTRKGKRVVGLCPFHPDRHPSLTVDMARQSFVCYACGARGDVVAFVQQIERCSFAEAIEKLGGHRKEATPQKAMHTGQPPKAAMAIPDHSRMLELLHPYLTPEPALTRMYLEFEVGKAPQVLPSGWDYLKGRLVFPLRDAAGRLVGFAGRCLTAGNQPKYLNTSAAQGYNRNTMLYGLYRAKEAIAHSGRAYITEGYKDCIAMHAAGFTNTVAVCGTELSALQAELLSGYATEVVLLTDGDEAGQRAASKMALLLEEKGLRVCLPPPLPGGNDPDSLFTSLGMEPFREFIHRVCLFPHRTEYLLVTACLLFREATTRLQGEAVRCTGVIYSVLGTEQLPPLKPVHQEILRACTGDTPSTHWPDEVRQTALALENEYAGEVRAIRDVIAYRMPPGPAANTPDTPAKSTEAHLFERLLLLYMDARLKEMVRGLTGMLKMEKEPEVRKGLLKTLKARKRQHREVGLGLEEAW
ncbi:MAG: CHC2 zinc finger domain-containing protein [Tannerellaceae bacterium]|nr:CHC2 zinc finger domain-containing protein [Tannerellaceae bacterium]